MYNHRRKNQVFIAALFWVMTLVLFPLPTAASELKSSDLLNKTKQVGRETFQTDIQAEGTLQKAIGTAVNFTVGILGVIAVGLLVYAGYLWMTAGGNEEQIKKAKNTIKRVAIGIIIVTLSYAIVSFILSFVT
jgi:amino acid transporter